MIGYDTVMSTNHVAREVLTAALDENRTILTRNSVLAQMKLARNVVLLTDNDPWTQLRFVIKQLNLRIDRSRILTRCLEDNNLLSDIPKSEIRGLVWPYVYETQRKFTKCPACGRIYWPASHVEAMIDKLKMAGLI